MIGSIIEGINNQNKLPKHLHGNVRKISSRIIINYKRVTLIPEHYRILKYYNPISNLAKPKNDFQISFFGIKACRGSSIVSNIS